jgi:amino acid adenylation domain-containing protein
MSCINNPCIHDLFAEQAKETPNHIALVFKDQKLTYKELDEKATQLALYLQQQNDTTETLIGICLTRSIEMIVGILGILKAGAAYVPIDPEYPQARIQYIVADSGIKLLLTQSALVQQLTESLSTKTCSIIAIDQSLEQIEKQTGTLTITAKGHHLAYVIYTSGSTGQPKGTLIEHKSILRICKPDQEFAYIQISSADTLLQLSSFAFDGSIFDIFAALLNGARLVLIDQCDILQIKKLSQCIIDNHITVFFITTALFNTLVDNALDSLSNVRKILFGGEKVSVQHVNKAIDYLGKDKIIHVYGPTESTVFSTYYPVNDDNYDANIPIGKAIPNTQLYILDQDLNMQPVGEPGELCIGGDGLARCYLNQAEMTNQKFINNPFHSGTKIYKTGDRVVCLDDGNIIFLDRIDQQVKIRGFRIELGEIESVLLQHEDLGSVVVQAIESQDDRKQLVAYIICKNKCVPSIFELRTFLGARLPDYMIPHVFVFLDEFPLTVNGKVDRKKLPKPDRLSTHTQYVPPQNELDEKLVLIWERILKIDKIGINDNFFIMGGDSLLAAQVLIQVETTFLIEIALTDIYETPTIATLSRVIDTKLEQQQRQQELNLISLLDEIENMTDEEVQSQLSDTK